MPPAPTLYPKLRMLDIRPFSQQGQPYLLLRDPWKLSDSLVGVPQPIAPLLMLCDGTRDVSEIRLALAMQYGLRLNQELMDHFLKVLDDAFLLDNDRYRDARNSALEAYRTAPYRVPALAGTSYPSDLRQLRALLDGYLDAAGDVPAREGTLRGLLSPHIDYPRGGAVYARVWKSAAETVREADMIIIMGTDHYGGPGQWTLTRQSYATPYGVLPTATDVVDRLAAAVGEERAYAGEFRHRDEHSIELVAVWLHHIRGGQPCEIVPILCGSFGEFVAGAADPATDRTIEAIVSLLREEMEGRRVLVVASGDLAHVGPVFGGAPQGAREQTVLGTADEQITKRMAAGDAAGFFTAIQQVEDRYNICGLPPVYLALRLMGDVTGQPLSYERCPADAEGSSFVTVCGITFHSS